MEQLYTARNQFPLTIKNELPNKITFKDYLLRVEHGEKYQKNKVSETTFKFYLGEKSVATAKEFPIFISGDLNKLNNLLKPENYSKQEGFLWENKVYTKTPEEKAISFNPLSPIQTQSSIQPSNANLSLPLTAPATPFNWTSRNVLVILPYNNSYPVPANFTAYIRPVLKEVRQFFRANSENNFSLAFYPVPVFVSSFNPNSGYIDIAATLNTADPIFNYSNFDFTTIFVHIPPGGGGVGNFASMFWDYSTTPPTPGYYQTNEPIASAVAVVSVEFFLTPTAETEYLAKHEIGHAISFWNPQLAPTAQFFYGFVPHASGLFFQSCLPSGSTVVCQVAEYGDVYDIMGNGRGILSHHQSVNRAGLRSASKTQTINSSGTYTLCDINHPTTGCPQELLVDNPNGIDISIELRTPSGPDQFWSNIGCSSFLDGLIIRAANIKEGGALGNVLYQYLIEPAPYGGDILFAQSFNSTLCPSTPLGGGYYDYPVLVGQTMQTPLGDITLQALNSLPSGVKQASVSIPNYTVPSCVFNPPTIAGLPALIQIYNNSGFWPVNQFGYVVKVGNNDICIAVPETFQFETTVNVAGIPHTTQILVNISPSSVVNINLPIPPTLAGVTGTYPYTVTVTKVSNPSQNAVLTGNISLQQYAPQIFGPYGVSACSDGDPIPFTFQNLGANYLSNAGGIVTLNPPIAGIPPNFTVPDTCVSNTSTVQPISATDLVCGSNTGIPGIANQAFYIAQDCRFIMNTPYAACSLGTCGPYP